MRPGTAVSEGAARAPNRPAFQISEPRLEAKATQALGTVVA
jgi:hypothetical protein